jgi:hypothetical protein
MSDETVQCVCCKEVIKAGAIKCTKCDTFQDWRRYISIGNLSLGLLIALVANVTTLFQIYQTHVKTIEVQAMEVTKVPAYLQIALINTGNTVAIFRGGTLRVKRNSKMESTSYELRLFSPDGKPVDPFIEPNKGKFIVLQSLKLLDLATKMIDIV